MSLAARAIRLPFYAVVHGRQTGIFYSQVNLLTNTDYFSTKFDTVDILDRNSNESPFSSFRFEKAT